MSVGRLVNASLFCCRREVCDVWLLVLQRVEEIQMDR